MRRLQSGQSGVEFAVGLATLALLAMGTLAVGTWQEAQRRVIAAAREAAFEHLWGDVAEESPWRARLHRLHFGDAGLAMPLTGAPLADEQRLQVQPRVSALEGFPGAAEAALWPMVEAGPALSGRTDPGGRGWVGAQVILRPQPMAFLPEPLGSAELQLRAGMLLLDDAWSAAGPTHVAQRAAGLVPTHALASLGSVLHPLLLPLSLLEPSLRHFCPGLIDADGVPEDRLSPAPAGTPAWNSCR